MGGGGIRRTLANSPTRSLARWFARWFARRLPSVFPSVDRTRGRNFYVVIPPLVGNAILSRVYRDKGAVSV